MNKNICCSICHEDLFIAENRDAVCSTDCGHVFHYQCLIAWMERYFLSSFVITIIQIPRTVIKLKFPGRSKTCPHCRKNLSTRNIIKLNLPIEEKSRASGSRTKVAELENRIEWLSKSESDLRRKFQELVENNTSATLANEELK